MRRQSTAGSVFSICFGISLAERSDRMEQEICRRICDYTLCDQTFHQLQLFGIQLEIKAHRKIERVTREMHDKQSHQIERERERVHTIVEFIQNSNQFILILLIRHIQIVKTFCNFHRFFCFQFNEQFRRRGRLFKGRLCSNVYLHVLLLTTCQLSSGCQKQQSQLFECRERHSPSFEPIDFSMDKQKFRLMNRNKVNRLFCFKK